MIVDMIDKGQERQGSSPNRDPLLPDSGGKLLRSLKHSFPGPMRGVGGACRIIPESLGGGESGCAAGYRSVAVIALRGAICAPEVNHVALATAPAGICVLGT